MTKSAKRPATTKVRALLSASMTTAACRAMRVVRLTLRWGIRWVRLGSMPPRRSSSSVPSTATRSPGHHLVVPAGALGHFAAVPGHDGYRGQVAEVAAEGRMRGFRLDHVDLDHRELHPAQLDVVCVATQAGLHERRAGQGGHVQHAAPLPTPAPEPWRPRGWPAGSLCGRRGESL